SGGHAGGREGHRTDLDHTVSGRVEAGGLEVESDVLHGSGDSRAPRAPENLNPPSVCRPQASWATPSRRRRREETSAYSPRMGSGSSSAIASMMASAASWLLILRPSGLRSRMRIGAPKRIS